MLNFFFPAYCFHCKVKLDRAREKLCNPCKEQLSLMPPEGRCLKCFKEIPKRIGICLYCKARGASFKRMAACFETVGPAASLYRNYLQGNRWLARAFTAFIVLQIKQLGWPWPNLVTYVPLAWEERLFSGFDPSREIAFTLSQWIEKPLIKSLKKPAGFSLSKKAKIADQTILLIEGGCLEIFDLAQSVMAGAPAAIYGISFLESALEPAFLEEGKT